MLKRAEEIAAAARAARARVSEQKRAEQEEAAEEAKELARLDGLHRDFEGHAVSAARADETAITVTGHNLDRNRLEDQGFEVALLQRRTAYEEHLNALISRKRDELGELVERAVTACPSLGLIECDALLHRNPLLSLLETLWREKKLVAPIDVAVILPFIVQGAVKHKDLEASKSLLAQIFERYVEVKAIEEKHHIVRRENLMIPKGYEKATYVSWKSADDGSGHVVRFSAQRLSWLVNTWPSLASTLHERIVEVASVGNSQLEAFIWRANDNWELSWDWPPDDDYGDEGNEDLGTRTTGNFVGIPFCAPVLAAEELAVSGYIIDIEPHSLLSLPQPARLTQAHRMTIRWE